MANCLHVFYSPTLQKYSTVKNVNTTSGLFKLESPAFLCIEQTPTGCWASNTHLHVPMHIMKYGS